MDKTVRLYIVRHGETQFNLETRAQGFLDSPLTQNGIDIAAKLGLGIRDIDFNCAYSSDLGRAVKSAEIILKNAGKNIELIIDEDLRERCMGKLEGTKIGKEPWIAAEKKAIEAGFSDRLDIEELSLLYESLMEDSGVEPLEAFKTRLHRALVRICEKQSGESNILVVSHGLAILAMIYAITGNRYVPMFIKNASVTLIEYTENSFNILAVNDLSYVNS